MARPKIKDGKKMSFNMDAAVGDRLREYCDTVPATNSAKWVTLKYAKKNKPDIYSAEPKNPAIIDFST